MVKNIDDIEKRMDAMLRRFYPLVAKAGFCVVISHHRHGLNLDNKKITVEVVRGVAGRRGIAPSKNWPSAKERK